MMLLKPVDWLLDRITMYRLVLYYLIALLAVAAGLGALGVIGYNPLAIVLSSLYLIVVCMVSNAVFAYAFETPANVESSIITALILALIITPLSSTHNVLFLTAAGGLAIASKYILAIHKKHIFNPAAVAVLLTSLGAGETASWWIGNVYLLPFVVVGGLLVARKIRRMQITLLFFAVATAVTVGLHLGGGTDALTAVRNLLIHSSLWFMGFVMLTEPLTTPPTTPGRRWYAALTGALFPPQMHLFGVYATPELALSIGNVFSYAISPKRKLLPRLLRREQLAPDIADIVTTREPAYAYQPGKYVELTFAHDHADSRGNRRYLTLASSPTEDTLRFGMKFPPGGSSFKRALLAADDRARLAVSAPAGEFVLPKDPGRKLAFIAGGIGITPYRSMVRYLLDTAQPRDITLLYAAATPESFVYTDVFAAAARRFGMHTVYAAGRAPAGWQGHHGRITAELIAAVIPDYPERLFYLSGPLGMVTAVKQALRELGVPARHIKTDYFPGYA